MPTYQSQMPCRVYLFFMVSHVFLGLPALNASSRCLLCASFAFLSWYNLLSLYMLHSKCPPLTPPSQCSQSMLSNHLVLRCLAFQLGCIGWNEMLILSILLVMERRLAKIIAGRAGRDFCCRSLLLISPRLPRFLLQPVGRLSFPGKEAWSLPMENKVCQI